MKNVPLALKCAINGLSTPRKFLRLDNIYQSGLRLDEFSNLRTIVMSPLISLCLASP